MYPSTKVFLRRDLPVTPCMHASKFLNKAVITLDSGVHTACVTY